MDESTLLAESDPTIRRMVGSLIGEQHPDYQDWLQESRIHALLIHRSPNPQNIPWRPRLIATLRWFIIGRRPYRKWNRVQQPIVSLGDVHENALSMPAPDPVAIALRHTIEAALTTAGDDAAALWAYCRGERLHLAQRHQRAVEAWRPLLSAWRDD